MNTQLIEQYWDEVVEELQSTHQIDPADARESMARYRDELAARSVGRLLYNQPVERTAAAIVELRAESQRATQ